MPNNEDVAFYLDRERVAIAMSRTTDDAAIRDIHLDMAQRYANLAANPISDE